MEPHDYDKLKQEESDEQQQQLDDLLFKSIEPYIDGLNHAIKFHARYYSVSESECAEYVRETLQNLIQG